MSRLVNDDLLNHSHNSFVAQIKCKDINDVYDAISINIDENKCKDFCFLEVGKAETIY